ncbi:MAG: hypothetical protein QME60_05825 [Verrucomicrobiota bacterium]|nr:hypothetical protein [Verrucomicrobiota bacterium]
MNIPEGPRRDRLLKTFRRYSAEKLASETATKEDKARLRKLAARV